MPLHKWTSANSIASDLRWSFSQITDFQRIATGTQYLAAHKHSVNPSSFTGNESVGTSFGRLGGDRGLNHGIFEVRRLVAHTSSLPSDMRGLLSHYASLSFYGSKSSTCGANTHNTFYDQNPPKGPACLVHPISSYRHRGKFGDFYGLLSVWGC